jgi:hypothetical protein
MEQASQNHGDGGREKRTEPSLGAPFIFPKRIAFAKPGIGNSPQLL